jgi:hypothetical protein
VWIVSGVDDVSEMHITSIFRIILNVIQHRQSPLHFTSASPVLRVYSAYFGLSNFILRLPNPSHSISQP